MTAHSNTATVSHVNRFSTCRSPSPHSNSNDVAEDKFLGDGGLWPMPWVHGLPREQRIAVTLLYGEDMSVAEIAAITGVPTGTVKSRLSAARHALRSYMKGEEGEQA